VARYGNVRVGSGRICDDVLFPLLYPCPISAISREQLAVMLYDYAKYKGYDVSIGEDTNILSYNDALSISDYAYSALQWACGSGILSGDPDGSLNLHSSATRAEVAAVLERFFKSAASFGSVYFTAYNY